MSDPVAISPEDAPTGLKKLFQRWKSFSSSFLFVSIALHVFFGVGATYLVVQSIAAKRTKTFQSGPASPSRSQKQAEHHVQVAKQKQTSSAPAPPKRVAVAGLAKVSLPEMPSVPVTLAVTTTKLSGVAGTGGLGLGAAGGVGGAGGGGGGVPPFGLREAGGGSLRGTFYDLKQTAGRQSTNMSPDAYGKILQSFIQGGFSEGQFARFFKGPQALYTTQIFVPEISADLGPAAFGLQGLVQPRMWVVVYRGSVVPPTNSTFHFVGYGDDILAVRFNDKLVLERNWDTKCRTNWRPMANYSYPYPPIQDGYAKGDAIQVEAGRSYAMEVVIGEQPGGKCSFSLLIEEEGVEYQKDERGNPILPIFRLANAKPPTEGHPLQHAEGGPVWKGSPSGPSLLDQMRGR